MLIHFIFVQIDAIVLLIHRRVQHVLTYDLYRLRVLKAFLESLSLQQFVKSTNLPTSRVQLV
jgi:hypothetical protein